MRCLVNFVILVLLLFSSCETNEYIRVSNNEPPSYDGVSMLRIENYINRLFIDLLGREPTINEREQASIRLKQSGLKYKTRDSIITLLQSDTTYRLGDSSYRHAYILRVYDLMKYRFLEGASDPEIAQKLGNIRFGIQISRLNGDSVRVKQLQFEAQKYEKILLWKYSYLGGVDNYPGLCSHLMNNGIYDVINMGTFNFVNAAYDDVLGRWPNQSEFDSAYAIIEKNEPKVVFNRVAQNKSEFINALVDSDAFFEAQVRWWYFQYVRNEIEPTYLYSLLMHYKKDGNLEWVQRNILTLDNYAQF